MSSENHQGVQDSTKSSLSNLQPMDRRKDSLISSAVVPNIDSDEAGVCLANGADERIYRFRQAFQEFLQGEPGKFNPWKVLEMLEEYFNWILSDDIRTSQFADISDKIVLAELHRSAVELLQRCDGELGEQTVRSSVRCSRLREAESRVNEAIYWRYVRQICSLFGLWMFNGRTWWPSIVIWPLLAKVISLVWRLCAAGDIKIGERQVMDGWIGLDWGWVLFALLVSLFAGLYRHALVEEINQHGTGLGVVITDRMTFSEANLMFRRSRASAARLAPLLSRMRLNEQTVERIRGELRLAEAESLIADP